MKFTITIQAESLSEWDWLAERLKPEHTANVAIATPSAAIATHPNGETGEAAPEAASPKRGRPRKEAPAEAAPAPAPAPAPKAQTIPALQPLKDAITTHARLAMRGEGDKKILDLLPAFRDATGLDFVMNAEEQHREALFQLAIDAGVPLA